MYKENGAMRFQRIVIIGGLILIFVSVTGIALSAEGSVDVGFGLNGSVITQVAETSRIRDMALQSDGKIVTFGEAGNYPNTQYILARYSSIGQLDPTFGTNGFVTVTVAFSNSYFSSILVGSDDHILVAGKYDIEIAPQTARSIVAVVRYLENGQLDDSFGMNGVATWTLGNNYSAIASAIAVQSTGKIIVTGNLNNYQPFEQHALVIRLNPNGAPDSSFAAGAGYVAVDYCLSGIPSFGGPVAIRSDDGVVTTGPELTTGRIGVLQLTEAGLLDSTFGSGGIACINPGPLAFPHDLLLQSDDRVVIPGGYAISGATDIFVARLTVTGTLDTSFGGTGIVTTRVGPVADDHTFSYGVIQDDAKIILATQIEDDFALMRYSSIGLPDETFGPNGIITASIGSNYNSPEKALLQPDGKVLIGGRSGPSSAQAHFALMRFYAFIVPPFAPTLVSPPDNTITTTQTISLTWAPGAGPAPIGYHVELNGQMFTTTTAISVVVLPNGTYTWRVRAYNEGGYSSWSAAQTITTYEPLSALTMTGPSLGVAGAHYAFDTFASPVSVTTPITYYWQAAGQPPITGATTGISSSMDYSWDTPGIKAVTVTAQTVSGTPVTATHVITVVTGAQAHLTPAVAGSLVYTNSNGGQIRLEFPGNAVTQSTELIISPTAAAAAPPAGLSFAGNSFELVALRNGQPYDGFAFESAITVTLSYSDTDMDDVDESTVGLYFLQGNTWIDAATTCAPASTYSRDLSNNWLSVAICHLSEFALIGDTQHRLYLPAITRVP